MKLDKAIVYDCEVFPNFFSIDAEDLFGERYIQLVIAPWRDDRALLRQWFNALSDKQTPMIGFNNLGYDYNILHALWMNGNITNAELYELSQSIINTGFDQPRRNVYEEDRFAPQIDLMKVHHFDNKAKRTSLKALQINMRCDSVIECDLPFEQPINEFQANHVVLPYNRSDTSKTKKFAHFSMDALNFRLGMRERLRGDVMNFSDTKIGGKILEERLGENLCYDYVPKYPGDNNPRKVPRQTPRNRIALKDIIFPYIIFQNPEFQRVHQWMMQQVLTPDDLDDPDAEVNTKGVFKGIVAHVGGVEFKFGTGGIHASVEKKRFVADAEFGIYDIDVEGLYPNISNRNRLAPAHLGEPFVIEYAKLPIERREWQEKKGKKCTEANSMKLAGNGTYGNTKNKFSVFYDPQMTMTITINGQLMLCMLAEWLLTVPTLQIIQVNTDGITYRMNRQYEAMALEIQKKWEKYTLLNLERVEYSRMWIRDVNSYIAESLDGKLKQKGAYWHPANGDDYAKSISEAQPPAWHKDLGGSVIIKAAVAALTKGVPVETFIRFHTDPFDFMLRVKVDKKSRLLLGGKEIQRTTRYFIASDGAELVKESPPAEGHIIGAYKKSPKVDEATFNRVIAEIGAGVWDARIHTKNKSRHEIRKTGVESGWKVRECNDIRNFNFDKINFAYYVAEANKLLLT